MSSFLPVNSLVKMDGATGSSNSSTTPHLDPPKMSPSQPPASLSSITANNERDSGYGTVNGEVEKRSNNSPRVSNAASIGSPGRTHSREGSSVQSSVPEDNAAADSDADQDGGSDNDAEMGDSAPPSKKKKGQRFFCTDFPPCTLSFTRSEHLARHIRYVLNTSLVNHGYLMCIDIGNIPENVPSNAIVHDDFHALTIYDSMHRQYM